MKLQLTYEEVRSLYFDDSLIAPSQMLKRVKVGGSERYYYVENPDGSKSFFIGVTSASKLAIPTSPGLIQWIVSKGSVDAADDESKKAAAYGTNMHIALLQEFLINRSVSMENLEAMTRMAADAAFVDNVEADRWVRETKRDLLAFAQFVEDYSVKPIAIEFPIASPNMGLGGTIDLVCKMTIKEKGFFGEVYKTGDRKGEPKETTQEREIVAIVDLKSGRKGFYEEHEFQLHSYRRMWNAMFQQHTIERVYDWSPKEWKTTPSYNFTDQTGSIYAEDEVFGAVLSIARRKAKRVEGMRELVIADEVVLDKPISEQFDFVSLEEML